MPGDSNEAQESVQMWLFHWMLKSTTKNVLEARTCLCSLSWHRQQGQCTSYCKVPNYLLMFYATIDIIFDWDSRSATMQADIALRTSLHRFVSLQGMHLLWPICNQATQPWILRNLQHLQWRTLEIFSPTLLWLQTSAGVWTGLSVPVYCWKVGSTIRPVIERPNVHHCNRLSKPMWVFRKNQIDIQQSAYQ